MKIRGTHQHGNADGPWQALTFPNPLFSWNKLAQKESAFIEFTPYREEFWTSARVLRQYSVLRSSNYARAAAGVEPTCSFRMKDAFVEILNTL